MDKTAHTELRRLFLIETLPEPLTRASAHIQLFDNYIAGTRLRVRLTRDPATRASTRVLQQHIALDAGSGASKVAEMYLDDREYAIFEPFEGREIRMNRYFHEYDAVPFAFDVYLGGLWGLITAGVEFVSVGEMRDFEPPSFCVFEVTGNSLFIGSTLVDRSFEDVRGAIAQLPPIEAPRPPAIIL